MHLCLVLSQKLSKSIAYWGDNARTNQTSERIFVPNQFKFRLKLVEEETGAGKGLAWLI